MITTTIPLQPKNPSGPLQVIIIGRISTSHQDMESISASYRVVEAFLAHAYKGLLAIQHLGEQASGMLAERETIVEAESLIATGDWDLVIVEDLSRIFRNPRFQWAFVQDAVDHQTRVICIADNIDTADEHWETMMHAGTLRHGLHVPDTRRRVRRTATHAFHSGGMVQKCRFGYRKLTKEEAATGKFGPKGLRITKLSDATPIIQAMKSRVLRGATYVEVADWLNCESISPGPYVKTGHWTGRLVETLLRDPILHGTRIFRTVMYDPIFRTGKHRRRKNAEPETAHCPELAHLTAEEHQVLLQVMDERASHHAGPAAGKNHPLYNKPRSRALWPSQHLRCGICGGLMYRYGLNQLKCQNAHKRGPKSCWNHVQLNCAVVCAIVLPWIFKILNEHEGVREMVIHTAWQEFDLARRRQLRSGGAIDGQIQALETEARNLAAAIALGGNLEALVNKSIEVADMIKDARETKAKLESQRQIADEFMSRDDIAGRLDEAMARLATTSFEFASFMRRLVPDFVIWPVQDLDRGLVRPRATLTLRTDAWSSGSDQAVEVSTVLDLFEPPLHVKHRGACVAARQQQPTASLDTIAGQLHINRMVVKRALAYNRQMQRLGVTDPYRELREMPTNASRWLARDRKAARRSA